MLQWVELASCTTGTADISAFAPLPGTRIATSVCTHTLLQDLNCTVPLAVIRIPLAVIRIPLAAIRIPLAAIRIPLAVIRIPLAAIRIPLAAIRILARYEFSCVFHSHENMCESVYRKVLCELFVMTFYATLHAVT